MEEPWGEESPRLREEGDVRMGLKGLERPGILGSMNRMRLTEQKQQEFLRQRTILGRRRRIKWKSPHSTRKDGIIPIIPQLP